MTDTRALITTPAALPAVIETTPDDRNPAAVYLTRLSPGSRRAMRGALDAIAGLLTGGRDDAMSCAWAAVRYQHTAAIRAALAERYAPATTNKHLAALRGVLAEAWRLGQLPAEDYRRAVDVKGVRSSSLPRGRALSAGELRTLFAACAQDTGPAGVRDAALFSLAYGCGLRRAELVALDHADVDPETGAVTVRHGKGDKARLTYAANGGLRALCAWLAVRGDDDGPLFWPIDRHGRLLRRRLTPQAVLDIARRRAAAAGVARFSPHDLRRSFVSDLLEAGADVATVQRLAGHANVQTTARYDRRGEQAKRRAASLLHVPYVA